MPEPGKPLEKEIIDEAYRRYADGESINSIAKALHTTGVTLHKYKKAQNWARRIKEIQGKIQAKADSEAVNRRRRHQRQYQHMAAKGSKALRQTATGKFKPKDAISAIDTGIKGEREVLGDSEQDEVTITVKLPKGMRMADLCQNQNIEELKGE